MQVEIAICPWKLLPPRYWQQEEGVLMESVLAFIVAVAAGVACHYIIKWLDGDD